MTPIALIALVGIALLIPVFLDNDDESDDAETPVEPTEPVEPIEPVEPVEPTEPLPPATATLDAATNTVTVTTDPEETGTIYTVANRVDFFDGASNFVYETSVILVPEGIDFQEEAGPPFEDGDPIFYYDILSDIGATELGFWSFDPSAAEGEEGAIQDFIYPEGVETGFLQIYSTNFGDGGQVDEVVEVESEDNLADDIEELITSPTIALIEDNGGTVVTLPTDFDGELAVLETTTDYFFEDQLVRTDVALRYFTVAEGGDFATSVLSLADEVSQTPTSEGTHYVVSDGSLTETELFSSGPGIAPLTTTGVSIIEYGVDGNTILEETAGGLGVTANVDIMRFEAHIDSVAIPTAAGNAQNWNTAFNGGVVTSFGNIANTPAEDGAVDGSSIST